MLLAAIATLFAAAVQTSTGLGFAMVAAPALLAVLAPREALTTLLLLGTLVSLLLLFAQRRPLTIRWPDLLPVLAAAAPGVVLGVLVLEAVTKAQLQALTGLVVIAAALVQLRMTSPQPRPAAAGEGSGVSGHPASIAGIGLLSGGLTTATSVNGPPLVLWLLARGAAPEELRDTMAAAFLPLNLLGLVAVSVSAGGAQVNAGNLAVLAAVTVLGWLLGRPAFERLRGRGFRAAVLGVVLVAGLASLLAGLI